MGIKADFYIKDGDSLKWQGSVEWNCDEKSIPNNLVQSSSNEEFLENLSAYLSSNENAYTAGWPWHWNSSKQSDYAYIMNAERGAVYISRHNSPCYTIYDYRNYKKRAKAAKREGKTIEDFISFIERTSPLKITFPLMR